MKKFFLLSIATFILVSFSPKKRHLKYPFVISGADLIVEGTIEQIQRGKGGILKDCYQLKITDHIKTNTQRQTITVQMFEEWTCDKRRLKVLRGQKLLLFLKEGGNGFYQIINGSTGELIIENDSILNYIDLYPSKKYSEFKEGVKMFVDSYEYNGPLYPSWNENIEFKKLISQKEINSRINENVFFKLLSENIKKYL